MKKNALLVSRLALAVTLGAAANEAWAEDFEFDVPVEVSKMDTAFTQGQVHCDVVGMVFDSVGVSHLGKVIVGSGSTTFALVNGGFKGTVSVRFNANRPQYEPRQGRQWYCGLVFVAPSGSVSACLTDVLTGAPTFHVPSILALDPKSSKVCTQGTITPPSGPK